VIVPGHAILIMLIATGLMGLCALLGLGIGKLYRQRSMRREVRERDALRDLPIALAAGRMPRSAPRDGRGREVALEMMVDAVSRLRGSPRAIARTWFETNGFVVDAIRELGSRKGWRRARAAYRLGRFGSPAAEQHLVRALGDPRYEVRDAAARALGRVGGPTAVAPLLEALEGRRVARGLVSGALLELPATCDQALSEAIGRESAESRRLVAHVIGLRGRPAGQALLQGLRDEEPEVRRESALALARVGNALPGAELELRRLARDRRPWARAAAATALGMLLGDSVAPTLSELAGDEDFWVGYRAAEALTDLTSGAHHGWQVLMSASESDATRRAQRRCLEMMERRGQLDERLRTCIASGGADLDNVLGALERAGSRAWVDVPP
jgi:hypothetical protein